jgi:DNA polymerase III subunit delta
MAALKPAYLIHGEDHGAVGERRVRLRALAEADGGAGSVELLEGEAATPAGVALALSNLTFAIGRRVIVVDGVERFTEAEVNEHIVPAMSSMLPDTTIAFFAREEGRAKVPPALHEAVKAIGGQVSSEATVKPWELPRWAREQARRMGISIDAAAAKALVAQVGDRPQRLLRELEKLALEADSTAGGVLVSVEDVERRAAHSVSWRTFALADALVGGDAAEATRAYLRLRAQGERLVGLIHLMARRLREAEAVSVRLQAGEGTAEVKRGLRMPPRAAERFIAEVMHSEPEYLRGALQTLADLELDSRGGALLRGSRSGRSALGEDTLALSAILQIAG